MDDINLGNLHIDGVPGILFYSNRTSTSEDTFDKIIGTIEDIIVDEEFQMMLNNFMEKYYIQFDDNSENKLEYTSIFNEYVNKIEKFIEGQLNAKYPGFDMDNFIMQLEKKIKQEQLEGEVFEVLSTFSDFIAFRDMFQDYKAFKEGNSADLSTAICVTSLPFKEPTVNHKTV